MLHCFKSWLALVDACFVPDPLELSHANGSCTKSVQLSLASCYVTSWRLHNGHATTTNHTSKRHYWPLTRTQTRYSTRMAHNLWPDIPQASSTWRKLTDQSWLARSDQPVWRCLLLWSVFSGVKDIMGDLLQLFCDRAEGMQPRKGR